MNNVCKEIQEQLADDLADEAVKEHVAVCSDCSEIVRALSSMDGLIQSAPRYRLPKAALEEAIAAMRPVSPKVEQEPEPAAHQVPAWRQVRSFIGGAGFAAVMTLLLTAEPIIGDNTFQLGLQAIHLRFTELVQAVGLFGGLMALFIPGPKKYLISGVFFGSVIAEAFVSLLAGHP